MAAISVASSTASFVSGIAKMDVIESIEQATLIAASAITAGMAVGIDSNGKFAPASDATAGAAALFYGIATSSAAAGQAVTAIAQGIVGGFVLSSQAFKAAVFLNGTSGGIGDAAGTSSKVIGEVVPVRSQQPGSNPDKALRI